LTHSDVSGVSVEEALNEKIVLKQTASAAPTQFAERTLTQRCAAVESIKQFVAHS
jgi:hypothetical protein